MVFFNKTIPATQEAFLMVRNSILDKQPLTEDNMKRLYSLLRSNSRAEGERVFVVMTAQNKGWSFAKDLDFYQEGTGYCQGFFGPVFNGTFFQVMRLTATTSRWQRSMPRESRKQKTSRPSLPKSVVRTPIRDMVVSRRIMHISIMLWLRLLHRLVGRLRRLITRHLQQLGLPLDHLGRKRT